METGSGAPLFGLVPSVSRLFAAPRDRVDVSALAIDTGCDSRMDFASAPDIAGSTCHRRIDACAAHDTVAIVEIESDCNMTDRIEDYC